MKRKLLFLATVMVVALFAFAACGSDDDNGGNGGNGGGAAAGDGGRTVINLWSFTDEVTTMAARFKELNPEFGERFEVVPNVIATDGGGYQLALDMALAGGGADMPDIFTAESAFVVRYTQGDMAQFALPFSELGIDNVQGRLAEARIAPFISELGTRDGELVGLAFQHTGGAMIYRRDLAEQVWGNSDPEYVRTRVGPGWNRFFQAAAEMDAAGISMVSGADDVWFAVRNTGSPWIVDNSIDIHPYRMAMFDHARTLYQNGWMNDAEGWSAAWNADMGGVGERPVFAFFGPAWLINHVMVGHVNETHGDWAITVPPVGFSWGGTWLIPSTAANRNDEVREGVRQLIEWITLDTSETGLQHHWANGTLFGPGGTKDAVASGVVMDRADGTVDMLGGQDMFDVFIPAGEYADGTLFTQHDETINSIFIDHVMYYARGTMTRDEALASFRANVSEQLAID